MPPTKTLTTKNLEALGAEQLAELLIEIGDTNGGVNAVCSLNLPAREVLPKSRAKSAGG